YARPELLARHGRGLSREDRALLEREQGSQWTVADVPLLDELAELLGPHEGAAAARAEAEDRRRRAAEVEFAAEAISAQDLGDGLITPEILAERFHSTGPRLTTAERAAEDRTWTYGHVVVDEAQELSPMAWLAVAARAGEGRTWPSGHVVVDEAQARSPMAWRALLRRCPSRSMTVVGDLAQRSGHRPAAQWADVLGTAAGEHVREAVLTISYR